MEYWHIDEEVGEQIANEYYQGEKPKVRKVVDLVLFKLKFTDENAEDFYNLADEIFCDVLKRYDGEQDFNGFLYSCLMNKFKTEMTRRNRYKRQADRMAISWDTPIGEDDSGTVGDMISDGKTVESEIFVEEKVEWRREVREYLEKLSPLQRQIAFLLSDNNTPDEICEELHITMKHFENSLKRILADERIKSLRPLIERM